jgi:hypothetical protein
MLGGKILIPKQIKKKRPLVTIDSKFIDKEEWNLDLKPKYRKILEEEQLIIKNFKEILPLWDCKSSRFNMHSDMLCYIMNEIYRQFRSDNYDVRNILTTAFEFYPKLCILSLINYWPFNVSRDQFVILRDTRFKKPMISKYIDFLMVKENWLEDYNTEDDDSSEDEVIMNEAFDVVNEIEVSNAVNNVIDEIIFDIELKEAMIN